MRFRELIGRFMKLEKKKKLLGVTKFQKLGIGAGF